MTWPRKGAKSPARRNPNQKNLTADFTDFTDSDFLHQRPQLKRISTEANEGNEEEFSLRSLRSLLFKKKSVPSVPSVVKSSLSGAMLAYRNAKGLLFMRLLRHFAAILISQSIVYATDDSVIRGENALRLFHGRLDLRVLQVPR
jgi:hypothetical protein